MFDVPDEGVFQLPLREDRDDTSIPVIALDDDETYDKIESTLRHICTINDIPTTRSGASAQECTRGKSPNTNDQGRKITGHDGITYGSND